MQAVFGEETGIEPGTIIMWAGKLSNIPSGWVICDGNNGTPNLLDRFVHGVPNSTTNPGGTGGTTSRTLSSSQMAQHGHGGSTDSVANHNHDLEVDDSGGASGSDDNYLNNGTSGDSSEYSNNSGGHSHTVGDAGYTGQTSPSSFGNVPHYYEVAFIQKT